MGYVDYDAAILLLALAVFLFVGFVIVRRSL